MKRTLSFLLALLMTVAMVTVIPVTEAAAATVITNASPAITGNAGANIDLTSFSVELSDGTILSSPTWTSDGKAVTTVKFDTKGVYKLTAAQNGKSRTVYAVIKNASDTEYVLYENGFNAASDIQGLQKTANGTVSVKDGKLVMDTTGKSNTILLMPDWLKDFGNYNIETSAAMISSADASRWFSICYRYAAPYYMHMCVRKSMPLPAVKRPPAALNALATTEPGVISALRDTIRTWNTAPSTSSVFPYLTRPFSTPLTTAWLYISTI